MRKNLGDISRGFVARLMRASAKLSPDAKVNAAKRVDITDTATYRSALREEMAKIAAAAIESARKDVPKAAAVKLAGETSGVQLSEFDNLPPNVKRMVDVQSELIISGQVGDLKKNILLQFTSSVASTDSDAILEDDLLLAGSKVVDGAAVGTGAGTTSAQVTNTARLDFFEDPEVSDQVEAFQFVNGDPVSPICQDLAGTIFSKDDPMASRYMPPLHHNCKSYIVPILKGELGSKEVANLRPSKSSLEKYITLAERGLKS
jgi:SPP1 gp7 family putative phage head morphogenesis protein